MSDTNEPRLPLAEAVAELVRRAEAGDTKSSMAQTGGGMCQVALAPVLNYIGNDPAQRWQLRVWVDYGAGQPWHPSPSEIMGTWIVMPGPGEAKP